MAYISEKLDDQIEELSDKIAILKADRDKWYNAYRSLYNSIRKAELHYALDYAITRDVSVINAMLENAAKEFVTYIATEDGLIETQVSPISVGTKQYVFKLWTVPPDMFRKLPKPDFNDG